jgi:N-dimethylarginine dimethylaminohydrolase
MNKIYFLDSEYKLLRAVMLYPPGPEIAKIDQPAKVLHLQKIAYRGIQEEYRQIIRLYKKFKVKVWLLDPGQSKVRDRRCLLNLMYTRDLFFMSPKGAIIAKMAEAVRAEEVEPVKRFLKDKAIPIIAGVKGKGTFEGADALWVNSKLVMVGVGNRTNAEGFRQVKNILAKQKVNCVSVSASRGTLHLLGAVQFIDADLALVRSELVDAKTLDILKHNKIHPIHIPENSEVRDSQAHNIVTIAPRQIVMPAGCPRTKKIYEANKVKIAAQVKLTNLAKGAGGLACATAVISRDIR